MTFRRCVEEIERIVRQIRARWRRVKILLRADRAFARDALMTWSSGSGSTTSSAIPPRAQLKAESPSPGPRA